MVNKTETQNDKRKDKEKPEYDVTELEECGEQVEKITRKIRAIPYRELSDFLSKLVL